MRDISSDIDTNLLVSTSEVESFDELDIAQNFDFFNITLDDENESSEINIFNNIEGIDDATDMSGLSNFFEPESTSLINKDSSALANKPISTPQKVSANKPIKEIPLIAKNVAPYISETIRVDLPRLERLNNFSSELVTQENASILQSTQL